MKGIQQGRTYYGSVNETIITIEADERTPLLVDRVIWPNNKTNRNTGDNKKHKLNCGLSSWSFDSGIQSNGSDNRAAVTKSFKSHFLELKVLAFALILAVAISIAIYLLVIESRLPPITLSLDLVSHDIWSSRTIPKCKHLQYYNVDHIIIMQIGNKNCDKSGECLQILLEMQKNEPEELPYNFLIGGNGQVYEVRGWKCQSSIEDIPHEKSLIIGIIGNFDESYPQNLILQTIQSLIKESSKRRMINKNYYIHGLLRNDHDRIEFSRFFSEITQWPKFKGFLTNQ